MTSHHPSEQNLIAGEIIEGRASDLRADSESAKDLARLGLLVRLMDNAFAIPGTKLRFGIDSIIGLFPGIGDLTTSAISLYFLKEAHRRGVSRSTMARMGFNIFVDWLIGSIPIVGDAFDVYWKSNHRNMQLLLQHRSPAIEPRRTVGDWAFLLAIMGALMALLVGSLTISYFALLSLSCARRFCFEIAIKWCGIVAFIQETSSTVA